MNNTVTICNVNIHRDAKMSPTELVAKLKNVEVLRTWNSNNIYSYYLTSKYEIANLKHLHKSINSGNIKIESSKKKRRKYIFGLTMNKYLFEWFKRYKYKEILAQIYA